MHIPVCVFAKIFKNIIWWVMINRVVCLNYTMITAFFTLYISSNQFLSPP